MTDDRKALQIGVLLLFDRQEYIIEAELGRGATGIVYKGYYCDMDDNVHVVRIKELYPWSCDILREDDGSLRIPEDKRVEFEEAVSRFTNAYYKNIELRNTSGMRNSTVDFMGKYAANNTLYYVMANDEGMDYSHDCDTSLKSMLERIQTLCRLVGAYHKQGMLLLDIKPENIFILPETTGLIKMFDFESIVLKDDLKEGKALRISYTDGYAAYEVKAGIREKICEASDVFAIGAIVFWKLFGRTPEPEDCSVCCQYDFRNSRFGDVKGESGLCKTLSEFLHKSLAPSLRVRAGDVGELEDLLNLLVRLSDS